MTCNFGAQPQSGKQVNQSVQLYAGINPLIVAVLVLLPQSPVEQVNLLDFCPLYKPDIQDINAEDLLNPEALYSKIRGNALAKFWFENCECRLPPVDPDPIPRPPDLPEIPDDPENPVIPPDPPSCPLDRDGYYVRFIVQELEPNTWQSIYLCHPYEYISLTYRVHQYEPEKYDYELFLRATTFSYVVWQRRDIAPSNVSVYFCGDIPEDGAGEGGDNREPIIDIPQEGMDCLKQPDKAEIISILKLYISESNDRIKEEIIDSLSAKTSLDKGDIAGFITSAKNSTVSAIEFNRTVIISRYEALRDKLDVTEQTLKDWIDGAKNQTLTAIGASTAAIGAGIVAATTTITTAVTASTATVTGAISTATTTLTSAINSAKDDIKNRIKTAEDKIIEDLTEEALKARYRYRTVTVSITAKPSNISKTLGRTGAPDKYCFGWVMWRSGVNSADYAYTEREYINTEKSSFVCPYPNEDLTPVVHLLPNVAGQATLGWSNNEFKEG